MGLLTFMEGNKVSKIFPTINDNIVKIFSKKSHCLSTYESSYHFMDHIPLDHIRTIIMSSQFGVRISILFKRTVVSMKVVNDPKISKYPQLQLSKELSFVSGL